MAYRALIWLFALCAFALPPVLLPAAVAAPAAHAAMSDCPYHAPTPPENCPHQMPAKQMAKHMGGLCCLVMVHVVALMPGQISQDRAVSIEPPIGVAVRDLAGLSLNKDPPPPRV